jgi:hypothetical protein
MRRLGMFLADVVLGGLLAGAVLPLLIVNGLVESQVLFWVITGFCVALVAVLHGTFRPPAE